MPISTSACSFSLIRFLSSAEDDRDPVQVPLLAGPAGALLVGLDHAEALVCPAREPQVRLELPDHAVAAALRRALRHDGAVVVPDPERDHTLESGAVAGDVGRVPDHVSRCRVVDLDKGTPRVRVYVQRHLFPPHLRAARRVAHLPQRPPSLAGGGESAMNQGPRGARFLWPARARARGVPGRRSKIFGAAKKPIHDRYASLKQRTDNAPKLPGEAGDPPPLAQHAGEFFVSKDPASPV